MFKQGLIIYFKNFVFNNGDKPKEKYFIVLKNANSGTILGSLPTRKDKIPHFVNVDHGCVNIQERQYNSYVFQKCKIVCTNGFSFDMRCLIYGSDVDYYEVELMKNDYPIEFVDYAIQGELIASEFESILTCFINSNSIKRGIKRKLQE